MSALDLPASIARAEHRLGKSHRQARSDKGRPRTPPGVEARLHELLLQPDKLSMGDVERELRAYCVEHGVRPLARASLYNALDRVPLPVRAWSSLPRAVQQSLYNLGEQSDGADIPCDQIVFYAFNYGSTVAISFASGLSWLCLHRAARRPGWRPKSRALLAAIMKYRGI